MKTILNTLFFIGFLFFSTQSINAQDPNWTVNSANYQYSMTFTSFLNVNGATLTSTNDKVAAFVNGEIRGVSNVVFVASANKYVAYLSVYANADTENISFKIYNSATDLVVNIDKTEVFKIDGNLGGIFQSYSIASPQLNENAVFNSFDFLGITSVVSHISSSKINIVLPQNTNVTGLNAVFSLSTNSKVFVEDVLQQSNNSIHNFTNSIIYKVLSENEANLKEYEVLVSVALNSNPTTVVISTTQNLNSNSVPFSLDIAFSKVVSGFEKLDFVLENATVSSFSTSDSQNFKVEVIPHLQGVFSIQIPSSISLDVNNNQNEISNKIALNYDITKPIITAVSIEMDANSWWFLVTFNEDVVNIDVTDFELKGMASIGLIIPEVTSVSNNQYKVEVENSNTDDGVVSLQLKSTNDIKDIVGNSLVNSEFEAYFFNNEVLSVENDFIVSGFSMFPNPTSDFLNIKIQEGEIEQILLYNLNGKKVLSKKINKQQSIIDIQNLIRGIYVIKIISNNGILTKKLLKI
ncbi:MAG: hypothetical protein ACI93N_002290 [Flavobacteriaceae bacterium]|jgi:hypothetical protein